MAVLGKVARVTLAVVAVGGACLSVLSSRHPEVGGSPPPGASLTGSGDSSVAERCRGRAGLHVSFEFAREAPWQRGRRYELALSADGVEARCAFAVPLEPFAAEESGFDMPRCSLTQRPGGEPGGIILGGTPARVKIAISSDGTLLYRGEAAPSYGALPNDCIYGTRVLLSAETGRSAP